jgi:hypothetical protein
MSRRPQKRVSPSPDVAALQQLVTHQQQQLIAHQQFMSRLEWMGGLGLQFGGNRDLYEVFGYKRTLRFADYLSMYERTGVAPVVVDELPDTCWEVPPVVYEDTGTGALPGKTRDRTSFEIDWQSLVERLALYAMLKKVDKLARLGEFGGILLGVSVRQHGAVATRLTPGSLRGPEDLLYLTPFHQGHVQEITWVSNPEDPNFGAPEWYHLDLSSNLPGFNGPLQPVQKVHASRILHVAETTIDSPWFAIPALKPVYNYLENIEKIAGGGAEAFWQFIKRVLILEMADHVQPPESQQVQDELFKASHNMLSYIAVQGGQLKTLPVPTPDPTTNLQAQLNLIAAKTRIPKNRLIGAAASQWSTSEDEVKWRSTCRARNLNYTGPAMVLALAQRLMLLGACAPARQSLVCLWEPSALLSEVEEAQIGKLQTDALVAYSNSRASSIVPRQEYRVEFLHLDPAPPTEAVADQEAADAAKEEAAVPPPTAPMNGGMPVAEAPAEAA